MCRLFGMSGGDHPVRATFWLLEAPDSLAGRAAASRTAPGSAGSTPTGARTSPSSRWRPTRTRRSRARRASSSRRVFLAHIRYATTGGLESPTRTRSSSAAGCSPTTASILELERLERELGADRALVTGDTDSERLFALVTREIERHGGDVSAGIAAAARWVAEELPLYAINVDPRHARRALGAALPRHPRAVGARARRRRPGRRPPPRRRQRRRHRARALRAAVAPPVGDRRQRADGRGPGLARCWNPASCSTSGRRCRSTRRSSSTTRRPTC